MADTNVKIVVYVPIKDADNIRKVIGNAGGGHLGNYSHCSFSNIGIGRFKPNDKANPHIGEANKLEEVEEERIEFICKKVEAKEIIKKIKDAHPYEEVALDIIPLINEDEL